MFGINIRQMLKISASLGCPKLNTNMKSAIFIAVLAFAVACVLACDPHSNNMPECSSSNLNVPIRNFWDPTHYWMCNSAGSAAESVRCPDANGFDSTKGACVHFEEWAWTEPCPAA